MILKSKAFAPTDATHFFALYALEVLKTTYGKNYFSQDFCLSPFFLIVKILQMNNIIIKEISRGNE